MTVLGQRYMEVTMEAQRNMAKSLEKIVTIFEAILEAVKEETNTE